MDALTSKSKSLTQPFNWLGSKVRMRRRLYEIFKEIPRTMYIEPFGGSGAVFFGKEPEPSVYNDREKLLATFMRELRKEESRRAFKTLAAVSPSCREFFYELRAMILSYKAGEDVSDQIVKLKLDDYPVETAVAWGFFYTQNFAFGGKPLGESYGYVRQLEERGGRMCSAAYYGHVECLDRFAAKLRMTNIENKDWRDVLALYDAPTAFFYLDPPYECKSSKDYSERWRSKDTQELVDALLNLQASFVLSCYDGELYKPLAEICETRYYDARTTVCRETSGRGVRKECVYIKNNAPRLFLRKPCEELTLIPFHEGVL